MRSSVAGFLFSEDTKMVALISKLSPNWQAGKLNAIGGKIEAGEQPIDALVREFEEETGVYIPPSEWKYRAKIYDEVKGYEVFFFSAFSDALFEVRSMEAEQVNIMSVQTILNYNYPIIPNLRWLMPLCQKENLAEALLVNDAA